MCVWVREREGVCVEAFTFTYMLRAETLIIKLLIYILHMFKIAVSALSSTFHHTYTHTHLWVYMMRCLMCLINYTYRQIHMCVSINDEFFYVLINCKEFHTFRFNSRGIFTIRWIFEILCMIWNIRVDIYIVSLPVSDMIK